MIRRPVFDHGNDEGHFCTSFVLEYWGIRMGCGAFGIWSKSGFYFGVRLHCFILNGLYLAFIMAGVPWVGLTKVVHVRLTGFGSGGT